MQKLLLLLCVQILLCAPLYSQTAAENPTKGDSKQTESPKRPHIFRASKQQITQAQEILKTSGIYNGEVTGKLDTSTRAALKTYQSSNGLRDTGTLNRATLEKMGIELTEIQKTIPVSENSFAKDNNGHAATSKRSYFRPTKSQITEAQRILKANGIYDGEETGKMNDIMRAALRKYQEANGLKITGTLSRETVEKMGIEFTEKQKAAAVTMTESPK